MTTVSARSRSASIGRKTVISLVLAPTSRWAATRPVPVIAARRWTWVPSTRRAPRTVLPSTASERRARLPRSWSGGGRSGSRAASQAPIASSKASPSTRCRIRRTVASVGAVGPAGSRLGPPRVVSTAAGASAAHSAIAVRDFAPASTAHAASARTKARGWRRPLALRGSGTVARRSSSCGCSPGSAGRPVASRPRPAGMGDDDRAGTVFRLVMTAAEILSPRTAAGSLLAGGPRGRPVGLPTGGLACTQGDRRRGMTRAVVARGPGWGYPAVGSGWICSMRSRLVYRSQ